MGLTISNKEFTVFGTKRVVFCDIAFDASYPTGGESLTPSDLGLSEAKFVSIAGKSGYIFEYDYTNEKLKAMTPTANQGAVTTDKVTITASGAANITDGQSCIVDATFRSEVDAAPADEVGNTTDLSAVTGVKVMFIGR